jgi:hypothetical protein
LVSLRALLLCLFSRLDDVLYKLAENGLGGGKATLSGFFLLFNYEVEISNTFFHFSVNFLKIILFKFIAFSQSYDLTLVNFSGLAVADWELG